MGTVVFSVDAELVGSGERLPDPPAPEVRRRRRMWREILDEFDRHDVPATWAIVGRLFDHDDRPPLAVTDLTDAARERLADPEAYVARHRAFDEAYTAPDLVAAVRDAPADHEIGSHSFSHPRFTDLRPAAAERDLAACHAAASSAGVSLSSFVFPKNAVDHLDVLRDQGFGCFRGRAPMTPGDETVSRLQGSVPGLEYVPDGLKREAGRFIDHAATVREYVLADDPPALVAPESTDGLASVPASISLFRLPVRQRRLLRRLGTRPTVRRARQGIDAVIERDGVFHAWFHPHDLEGEDDLASLGRVLDYVATRREAGDLTVAIMAEVA